MLQQSNVRAPRQSGATTREVTAQGQFGSRTAATPESASTLHRGGAWAFPIGAALKSGSLIHDEDSPVSRRKTTYQSRVRDRGETRDDPRISFVVSWNPDVVLSAMLLHDLHSACVRCGRELVIVTRGPEILSGTSRVHIVPAPADADSAAMRAHGARRAAGDILLMLRDGTITGAALEALCLTSGRRESHLHLRSSAAPPALSVIIPVHRNEQTLESVLAAVRGSDMSAARTELIVVNDVGAPELTTVAARYADVIVRLEGSTSYGPAYARNRGFELATGELVVFLDADVRVHRDTLRRFARVFLEHPEVSAFVGSYDHEPTERNVVSQYRNLLRHFIHQCHAGDIATFWAGCGAIRADAFRQAGMFDEWRFLSRQLEDAELGRRLHSLGHRIVLCPDIQATHLKRWTLRSMIVTELHDRGVPWIRLAGASHGPGLLANAPRPLGSIRASLAWSALIFTLASIIFRTSGVLAFAALSLIPSLLANVPLYMFFVRTRGVLFALATVPLDILYDLVIGVAVVLGVVLREALGDPQPDPTTEAFAEVGLKTWPPIRARVGAADQPRYAKAALSVTASPVA